MCWELIAISNFLIIRMRVDIFGTEKCKVTIGLEYILNLSRYTAVFSFKVKVKKIKFQRLQTIKALSCARSKYETDNYYDLTLFMCGMPVLYFFQIT